MARPLRLQFSGAIYHVTARGNAQGDIVMDDVDRMRWRDSLRINAVRHLWEVLSYALMDNHLHLFVRTPEPNLARGMQRFLSGYASSVARRMGRRGHVFQGRYDAKLVEGATYFWNVSRYVHLNPVKAGLVASARDWPWSSFPGFADPARREPWVAYDAVLRSWQGDFGGEEQDARAAYIGFVESAVGVSLESPFRDAFDGWILGSGDFVERIRALAAESNDVADPEVPADGRLRQLEAGEVLEEVTAHWRLGSDDLRRRRNSDARCAFAHIASRLTDATRADIARVLGLARGQSVARLLWNARARLVEGASLRVAIDEIGARLDRRGQSDAHRVKVVSASL